MAKKYTVLETWIVNQTKPTESTSAEQSYDRVARQGGGRLPVIDVPQELRLEDHFLDEARIRDFVIHMGGAQNVLDIGPGDGWPLLRLASFFRSVTGAEAAPRRVETITANIEKLGLKNVTIKQTSALQLDFPDSSFDGIVASSAIEQTSDPYQALREIFRVLRPGGRFRVEFESCPDSDRGFTENLFLTETADSLGYHYSIRHHRPPWERNYLVKFTLTPEMQEAFRKLADLLERLGPNPSANPEIGLQFLEGNQAAMSGSTWYELEHFTSLTMKETLEDVGFINARVCYSAATLARTVWPHVRDVELTDAQAQAVCQGLSAIAVGMEAPAGSSEPVIATKPA